MKLNEVGLPAGRRKRKTKRLGRGDGSGHGGTSTKGHKGQRARAGGYHKVGFEGGQMPLQRRVPKRGFTNIFKTEYAIVNLSQLAAFPSGTTIDADLLVKEGVIKNKRTAIKLLGNGAVNCPLTVKVSAASDSARQKVEAAGGKIEVISV